MNDLFGNEISDRPRIRHKQITPDDSPQLALFSRAGLPDQRDFIEETEEAETDGEPKPTKPARVHLETVRRNGKWWIDGLTDFGPMGPYDTRAEADDDRIGLNRTAALERRGGKFSVDER